ncbi:MAG: hypothetical protein DRR16_07325 [Candidatus Parabeggiatoa sp. nov. 3]|nr:MAG: hypothetical protein DRR00_10455 [Gammaproteobacteria bacterium]RKZ65116.1 MAG: hypothetical protein DRQ99_13650 [Gammaproteobacteria bacterium]RKZ87431.1 MAG: hypothetical protein DRR16_07325 [Gammaproteobacteria bacterium]
MTGAFPKKWSLSILAIRKITFTKSGPQNKFGTKRGTQNEFGTKKRPQNEFFTAFYLIWATTRDCPYGDKR